MKERSKTIDAARGIGIILVVLGHCFPDAASSTGISEPLASKIFDFCYTFHMPLMFFIAGVVCVKILTLDNKGRFDYIKSRFTRLIIPYLLIGFAYMPFKLVLSSFAHQPYKLNTLPLILFGENPNGGLWFLYALFLIQLFTAKFANEKNLPLMIFLCPVILASLNAFTEATGLNFYKVFDAFSYCQIFILGLWFGKDFKNYMYILNNRIYIYIVRCVRSAYSRGRYAVKFFMRDHWNFKRIDFYKPLSKPFVMSRR